MEGPAYLQHIKNPNLCDSSALRYTGTSSSLSIARVARQAGGRVLALSARRLGTELTLVSQLDLGAH